MTFWRDKRVLVTGHTGFKGSWLSLWLLEAGASVHGYALEPEGDDALFGLLGLDRLLDHHIGDIRDPAAVAERIATIRPDIVLHLAAQPLVRQSYLDPAATWDTNVRGTVNILQALRQVDEPCAAVIVTTDKVYDNREWCYAYRESDRLGGYDPYSSSKAAAELAVASWRQSFFGSQGSVRIATARAGNVIGGGDIGRDRIIPDLVQALTNNCAVAVRNPASVRPWQHVLEPLGGYLRLAQALFESADPRLQEPFNFGPPATDTRTVKEVVEGALRYWPGAWQDVSTPGQPHEAGQLGLSIEKARLVLEWSPKWTFEDALRETITWYWKVKGGHAALDLTLDQIRRYAVA